MTDRATWTGERITPPDDGKCLDKDDPQAWEKMCMWLEEKWSVKNPDASAAVCADIAERLIGADEWRCYTPAQRVLVRLHVHLAIAEGEIMVDKSGHGRHAYKGGFVQQAARARASICLSGKDQAND